MDTFPVLVVAEMHSLRSLAVPPMLMEWDKQLPISGVALLEVLLEQCLEWLKRPMHDLHNLLHVWLLKIDASMLGVVLW